MQHVVFTVLKILKLLICTLSQIIKYFYTKFKSSGSGMWWYGLDRVGSG